MLKKGLLLTAALAIAIATVPMFAAFEAHVINVTAQIENALQVNTEPIEFGTVFPEEVLLRQIRMSLSESFLGENDADDVRYVIKQKPKCWSETDQAYGRVTELDGRFICEQPGTAQDYQMLPVLCPFLSKHSPDDNDGDLEAFHGSLAWTPSTTEATVVGGYLAKSIQDVVDDWTIDLVVPCFEGACAQDNVIPPEFQLDPELEHKLFGCDLWIEVTGVSRLSDLLD